MYLENSNLAVWDARWGDLTRSLKGGEWKNKREKLKAANGVNYAVDDLVKEKSLKLQLFPWIDGDEVRADFIIPKSV